MLVSEENPEGQLRLETTWKEVNLMMKDDPVWNEVQDLEKLTAFEEVMRTLDRTSYHGQKAVRLRQERKRREAFSEMVRELLERRKVTHQTKWSEFVR